MLASGFIGIASAAGGFNAHTVGEKVTRGAIWLGITLSLLVIAYLTSERDADTMMDYLIISLIP